MGRVRSYMSNSMTYAQPHQLWAGSTGRKTKCIIAIQSNEKQLNLRPEETLWGQRLKQKDN